MSQLLPVQLFLTYLHSYAIVALVDDMYYLAFEITVMVSP